MLNVKLTENGIYHIFDGEAKKGMLSRYGIFATDKENTVDGVCKADDGGVLFSERRVSCEKKKKGYVITLPLVKNERLFGGGDATREALMMRGQRLEINISNIVSYGPMGVILSDVGWAFVLNCTYKSVFDCGKSSENEFKVETFGGDIDFYLIKGEGLKDLLSKVTLVTGRPTLLPKFAYGLTLVENEQLDARALLWDIKTLRDRKIPCDTIGLEPSWMSKYYDYTTEKKWNEKLFPFPSWQKENTSSDFTFFYPMRRMGMQLSLWLCENYDLFYKEDNDLKKDEELGYGDGAEIIDANFRSAVRNDKITKIEEEWFEHLKKFVDNGAAAFKLDGATQVLPHPDRLWGGKYLDEEVHNIYPIILAKQMERGYCDYTGRRLLLYSAGAFTGVQKYAATWAGDTGGGQKTLVSLMNYAMCGHSNTSCDIDVSLEGLHYGFLIPWSQYFCWANWCYPWFMGDELETAIREYSTLRSTLIPYLYTMAHNAYATGIPVLRPLPLVYEDETRFDNVNNAYMLGDCFYVGVFDMSLKLPKGRWVDYFTGKTYEGDIEYQPPKGKGGALFVKEGSVFVTMVAQNYVMEKTHDYILNVYPGKDCEFSLYEDDGLTFDYREGGYATTRFEVTDSSGNGFKLVIYPREGGYDGRPDNGHDIRNNSIPKIPSIAPENDYTVKINAKNIKRILLDGESIAFSESDGKTVFIAPTGARNGKKLTYTVEY